MRVEMEWSRLKKSLESRFCEALQKRLCIHLTHYRSNLHEPESRLWFTLDKKEIFSISKLKWLNELAEICEETGYTYGETEKVLVEQGNLYIDEYVETLISYLSLPFDEALVSSNPINKALAMVDRRLGKRRLRNIVLSEAEHPFVRKFYLIRCEVENLKKGVINMTNPNQKLSTFLMFTGQAEEAMNFYVSLFDQSEIVSITRFGANEQGVEGKVQKGLFSLKGQSFMCFDSLDVHKFTFTPSISLFVNFDTDEELEGVYEKLVQGGAVLMPLAVYPFSEKFCWVQDRYGVSWQLNLAKGQ